MKLFKKVCLKIWNKIKCLFVKREIEDDKIISGNYWVAYFDILGFKNLLNGFMNQSKAKKKVDSSCLLDIFIENYYFDIIIEAKERVEQHRELLDKIKHTWFSDTFLFYIPIDEWGHSHTAITSLAQQFLVGCIWKGFPLAGAISAGEFHPDEQNNVFVGPALIDAHDYTEKQNWIGLVITPSACSELQKFDLCPPDRGKYIGYNVPVKGKKDFKGNKIFIPIVTEELYAFMMHKFPQVEANIIQMKKEAESGELKDDKRVMSIYENTLKFIRDTKC